MADTEHRFKYVFIPADESIPVEEREGIAVGSAGGDVLVDLLRPHFLRGGSLVDADAARKEAERHLGPEQAARLSPDRLVAATESGSTETFALVHPASTNGYRGVYLYTDECGKLKSLPENPRALELAQRCGIDVRHPFHGDAFVGAVKTSPPPMRNVSFTEHELDPGAPWMLVAPAENAVYAETFREFMSAVEGKATREELEHRRESRETEETDPGRRSRQTSEGEEIPPHGLRLRDGVATYHASLASVVGAPVSVENSCAAGGVGVVATRRITRGEAIWSEAPLVSIQSPANVDEALCCGWCHRAVGDIDASLSLACGAIDGDAARGNGTERASPPWIAVRSLGPSLAALGEAEGTPPIVRCKRWRSRGCKEVYCGDECARDHALAGHDVLCCSDAPFSSDGGVREEAAGGGGGDEAERAAASAAGALREFFSGNDNLHMIARVVGAMSSAVAGGRTWDDATLKFRAFVGIPWWETSGSTGAEKRLAKRAMRLMTESAHAAELNVAREADAAAEAGDEDAFRLAVEVRNVLHRFPDVLSRLGLDGVGHLLGVCDMNQLSMTIDGPMRNVCRKLLRVDEYEGADAAKPALDVLLPIALRVQAKRDAEDAAAGKPRWGGDDRYEGDEDEEEEEDGMEGEVRLDETADAEDLFDASRRLFGGFKGQALFSLLCLVNHSCEPSTAARFSSWKGRAMVRLEALRDIECGEELTMSYIDESETLEERTSALASYGFACRCNKCVGEGANANDVSDPDVDDNSDVD